MVVALISHLFKLTIRNDYISRYAIVFDVLSANITLMIYYYTSKTFGHAAEASLAKYETSFFEYVLIGEVLLTLPLFFLEGTFRKVKQAMVEGVWQTFSLLPIAPLKVILFLTLSSMPKELFRIAVLILSALLFFNFRIDPIVVVGLLIATFVTIPIFFSLGLVFSAVMIKIGRGQALLGYAITFLSVSAGAFFPLSVLPEVIIKVSSFSPYTILLENSRLFIVNPTSEVLLNYLWLIPWLLLIPANFLIFQRILTWNGKDTDGVVVRV